MRPVSDTEAMIQKSNLHAICLLMLGLSTACATTYRPAHAAPGAFTFTLTPEQCLTLKKERRGYRATEQTSIYMAGAGAVLTGVALAFTDEKTAPAIATSATLVSGAVGAFTGSQVESLDAELAAGGCER